MNTSSDRINGFSTAREMLAALRARRISAVELLELHLGRIARHNPALNAVVIRNDEEARRLAAEADARRARGEDAPLLGLPMTVKDWIEVAGWRSTAGDPNLKDYVAQADARVIARARAAGAVVIGKTNMPPWANDWQAANPVFGRTVNPWDHERTPGGSTGGGSAALAAGLTPLEWGNDIGGSVRVPAAFCGVYGHKPSESALPRTGQTPDASGRHLPNPATGLAMIGPMARSADDLALALDVAAGPDQGEDAAWRLRLPPARRERLSEFRVAVLPPLPWLPVDSEIMAACDDLAARLGRAGAVVRQAQPEGPGDLLDLYGLGHKLAIMVLTTHLSRETKAEIAAWGHAEAIKRNDPLIEQGALAMEASASDYIAAWGRREQYRAAYRAFFQDWDVLLTPMTLVPAFRHDEAPMDVDSDDRTLSVNGQPVPYLRLEAYPALATCCGQPATAFPFGRTRAGLPIGLQAIGPYLEDHTPLRFAALAAQEYGGFTPPPGYEA